MRWIIYTLLAYILIAGNNEHPFATTLVYGEEAPTTDKESSPINVIEKAEEGTQEIRIKKDEFDEIVGQLQGMKAFLESMKHDYDTRFKEMQEKIAVLGKENTELKKTPLEPVGAIHELPLHKIENEVAVGKVHSKALKVSVANEEEKQIPSRTDTIASSPSPSRALPLSAKEETAETKPSLMDTSTSQPMTAESEKWSPAQPLTVWSMGKNYMNISFDGLFAAGGSTAQDLGKLETGGHDPNQRGFTVQNLEVVFEGAVDPYFRGQSNIIFQIDKDGESFLEVEEAYLTSMSLPLNLQAKAGTFLQSLAG